MLLEAVLDEAVPAIPPFDGSIRKSFIALLVRHHHRPTRSATT